MRKCTIAVDDKLFAKLEKLKKTDKFFAVPWTELYRYVLNAGAECCTEKKGK